MNCSAGVRAGGCAFRLAAALEHSHELPRASDVRDRGQLDWAGEATLPTTAPPRCCRQPPH